MYEEGSWLQPIDQSGETTVYFENMSRAVALTCRGHVFVMSDTPDDLPVEGIWGTVEFPTLQMMYQQGLISTLTAISSDGETMVDVPLNTGNSPISERTIILPSRDAEPLQARATCNSAVGEEPAGQDIFG